MIFTMPTIKTTSTILVMVIIGYALPTLTHFNFNQALAQEHATKASRNNNLASPTISLIMHEQLQKAQQLSDDDDFNAAIAILDKMRLANNYSSYEHAMLWNVYAFIYYSKDDYSNTEYAYKKVLERPEIPETMYLEVLYSLAQVYFIQENYKEALSTLDTWFGIVEQPNVYAYILRGQSYYQTNQYNLAIAAITQAININTLKHKKIDENWYLLLRAIYYQQEDYPQAMQVMKTLVAQYPKKEYYAQLAAMYWELQQEFNQYSIIAAMYDANMLTKSTELVTYAQLLMQQNRPFRAAVILEQGLKDQIIEKTESIYQLLSNAWTLSRETSKAIPALKHAAQLSKTGNAYFMLGQSYLKLEHWVESVEAIEQAFKKGDLKRPDKANILLGIAYFNLQKYPASIVAFEKAQTDKRSKKTATQWLKYVHGTRSIGQSNELSEAP